MTSFIVVTYYTADSQYEALAKRFAMSCETFAVPYYAEKIQSKGNWYRNTQFKPSFLLSMMDKFPDKNIVWVDCDAEFLAYPKLFETLTGPIAAHLLDHKRFSGRTRPAELLSGTLFLKNEAGVRQTLQKWIGVCSSATHIWDQRALHTVIGDTFERLPAEYCTIFDYMDSVTNPVIKHYQASRVQRKLEQITSRH